MSLKDHATKVAVLRVLRDAVNAEYEAARRMVPTGLRAARAEFDLTSIRVTLPDDTARLVALVAAMCPSMHLEETTAEAWHALLADLDVADARAAVIRLGRQQRHIAAADIRDEVRAIREERLARDPLPLPDADPDDPHRYRAELLSLVIAIASGQRIDQVPTAPADPPAHLTSPKRDLRVRSLRLSCPWCRAAPGDPCVVPRLDIPLKKAPAHPARLLAAGLTEPRPGKDREAR